MTIEFKKQIVASRFLDPNNKFEEVVFNLEVRQDPLTGWSSLIYEGMDYPPMNGPKPAELRPFPGCPFCPANVEKVTPRFPEDVIPGGRIRVGEAIVVPNIRPYAEYSAVVPVSPRHLIGLDEFTPELLSDAFTASKHFAAMVIKHDPRAVNLSIGWNYMAPAGATMSHPHIQVNLGAIPLPAQQEVEDASMDHLQRHGMNFWEELIQQEKEMGERYIGATGNVHWLTPFAPRGRMFEVIAIFRGAGSFLDLSPEDISDFSAGLINAFKDLKEHNFYSFNLAIRSAASSNDHFYCHARINGRFTFFPTEVSDKSYMETLDGQVFSRIPPERMCRSLRKYFK